MTVKKMRKLILMTISMLLTMALFAGCGKKEEAPGLRIGGMKGPTSMGLLFLQEKSNSNEALENYEFQMKGWVDLLHLNPNTEKNLSFLK